MIHRMIFWELFKVFFMALTALTTIFLIAGVVQEASQRGLTPNQVLMFIPLFIPNTLPYTIPATTLFATCVVYGRMAHDNEVLVLKSVGVNTIHLIKPAFLLGIGTTLVTMFLYYETIPLTQQTMRNQLMNDAENVVYAALKKDHSIRHGNMPFFIFVKEVQGKRLIDVIIKQRKPFETMESRNKKKNSKKEVDDPNKKKQIVTSERYDFIIRAKEARLKVDLEQKTIYIEMEYCSLYRDNLYSNSANYTIPIPLPDAIFGSDPKFRPGSLSWEELKTGYQEAITNGGISNQKYKEENEKISHLSPRHPDFEQYRMNMVNHQNEAEKWYRLARQIEVEYHFRPAIAVGCLCFALIGCPVGVWASRADYLSSFVICFLPTVMIYYPLLLSGTGMAREAKVPVPVGIWAADVFVGLSSLFLIWRLLRK